MHIVQHIPALIYLLSRLAGHALLVLANMFESDQALAATVVIEKPEDLHTAPKLKDLKLPSDSEFLNPHQTCDA